MTNLPNKEDHNGARYSLFGKVSREKKSSEFEPGYSLGTGVVPAAYIIGSGGKKTYDDTTIDLSVLDTKERLARTQAFFINKDTKGIFETANEADHKAKKLNEEARTRFFNDFSALLKKPEIVGPYYPLVTDLERKEQEILAKGHARILSDQEKAEIAKIESEQTAVYVDTFAALDKKNIDKTQLKPIEDKQLSSTNATLNIRQKAAERVLGKSKDVIIKGAEGEVSLSRDFLSGTEIQTRKVERLESAASESKLTDEEKAELKKVRKDIDRAWVAKNSEKDFAETKITRDCSEFSNFSAVALSKQGIRVEKVTGHVYSEGESYVGSHAYNIIVERRGKTDYVAGVFESTADTNSYRTVKNNVTLQDFKANHTTLVTFNENTGWSTYGTGKYEGGPAENRDLDHTVLMNQNNIIKTDTKLIAKQKIDYTRSLQPEKLTDRLHDMMNQYNITPEDFDGKILMDLAKAHKNPRMAAAMQILVGLPDRKDATDEQRELYAKADKMLSNDDIPAKDLSRLAVTERTIAEYEQSWPVVHAVKKIHALINSESISPELRKKNPWIAEAEKLMKGQMSYIDSLMHDSKSCQTANKAYQRLETIVMDNNISMNAIEAIREEASKPRLAKLNEQALERIAKLPESQAAGYSR